MGQRLRLKSSFIIPESWANEEKAVLRALKKYGAIVADNGNFFSFSVTPDDRWPAEAFSHLASVSVTNFEVIQTTGPAEGPRSPGSPEVDAGGDQTIAPGDTATLRGLVTSSNNTPAVRWKAYAGPGNVTFADSTRADTTATFSTNGTYTLILSADDSIHAVAYDAVVVTVGAAVPFTTSGTRSGSRFALRWSGGRPPYVVESATSPASTNWQTLLTTNVTAVTIDFAGPAAFFRIRSPQ
jgi:hypothetical protein